MIGTRITHYKVAGKLGQGGMGAVYRAKDTRLDRDVAIKVLPKSFAEDRVRLARFERETKVLAALNHPNIAIIYGIEQSVETQALIMELATTDPTKAELVKLRYFVGLTIEQAAEVLSISPATAKRQWTYARAWLYGRIRSRR